MAIAITERMGGLVRQTEEELQKTREEMMGKITADVIIVLQSHSQDGREEPVRDEGKVQRLLDIVGRLKAEAEEVGKLSAE